MFCLAFLLYQLIQPNDSLEIERFLAKLTEFVLSLFAVLQNDLIQEWMLIIFLLLFLFPSFVELSLSLQMLNWFDLLLFVEDFKLIL